MTEQSPPEIAPSEEIESPEESAWRRYEALVKARLESATKAAEERRSRSRIFDSLFLILDRNRLLPASLLVGAMASRIVIYYVPLIALLIFSFGIFGEMLTGDSASDAAGQAGMAGLVVEAVNDSASLNDGFKFFVFFATLYATLYAANSLGRLIRRSFSLVWGVPYTKLTRAWLLPFLVIGLTVAGWFLGRLGSTAETWTFELVVGVIVVEVILVTAFWVLLSRVLPHDAAADRWTHFLPGAIFVALGVVGLRLAMVIYFAPQVQQLSERYGSIALGLVMLTWAYWLGMIIVGSAEINAAVFQSSRARR